MAKGWCAMRMWIWVGLMLLSSGAAGAQSSSTQQQQTVQPGMIGVPVITSDPERVRQEQQREHMAMDERRKKIVSDTDRLLTLATQLKADVDKSTKNELSLEVIKKAAEIEKLAHEVKERMRN